jgi:hypothetical protein
MINREIMRLKGLFTMSCIYEMLDPAEAGDVEIAHSVSRKHCTDRSAPSLIIFHAHQVLQVLDNWQLKWRNKIEDCGIENRIETLMPRLRPEMQDLAQQLLERWRELPLDYEIPRIDPVSRYFC